MGVIHRNIDFSIGDVISLSGEDSDVYKGENGKIVKVYGDFNPDLLLSYHAIQNYFSKKGMQIIDTPSGTIQVEVLALGDVYCDEKIGYYTTPDYVDGRGLCVFGARVYTANAILKALGVHEPGTNGLIDYNSKVTSKIGDSTCLTITDLGGKIYRFVENNNGVLNS